MKMYRFKAGDRIRIERFFGEPPLEIHVTRVDDESMTLACAQGTRRWNEVRHLQSEVEEADIQLVTAW